MPSQYSRPVKDLELLGELGLADASVHEEIHRRRIEKAEETARNKAAFLEAYAKTATIKFACVESKVDRKRVTAWKKEDPEFLAAMEAAEADFTENLEKIVYDRASTKSDILLMFMLKKRDPSYRENFKMEHSGEVAVRVVRYDGPEYDPAAALPAPAAGTDKVIETTAESPSPVPDPRA